MTKNQLIKTSDGRITFLKNLYAGHVVAKDDTRIETVVVESWEVRIYLSDDICSLYVGYTTKDEALAVAAEIEKQLLK